MVGPGLFGGGRTLTNLICTRLTPRLPFRHPPPLRSSAALGRPTRKSVGWRAFLAPHRTVSKSKTCGCMFSFFLRGLNLSELLLVNRSTGLNVGTGLFGCLSAGKSSQTQLDEPNLARRRSRNLPGVRCRARTHPAGCSCPRCVHMNPAFAL